MSGFYTTGSVSLHVELIVYVVTDLGE